MIKVERFEEIICTVTMEYNCTETDPVLTFIPRNRAKISINE